MKITSTLYIYLVNFVVIWRHRKYVTALDVNVSFIEVQNY